MNLEASIPWAASLKKVTSLTHLVIWISITPIILLNKLKQSLWESQPEMLAYINEKTPRIRKHRKIKKLIFSNVEMQKWSDKPLRSHKTIEILCVH